MSEAMTHTTPRCPHFGICGGCQHQDLVYTEQLGLKRTQLEALLRAQHIEVPNSILIHSAEPYEYRNRIRLRLERIDDTLRFGYNKANTTDFLPIVACPISAPILVQAAEALIAPTTDRDVAFWLNAASEVELFCDHDQSRLQLTLHCAPRTKVQPGSFARAFSALQSALPQLIGAGAIAAAPRTGPTGRILAKAGAPGLAYRVTDETYWITRGGFFQINRFLIETLVGLVCTSGSLPHTGTLAWDLFAGVGLFSRVLARSFERITAVESNPTAAADLRATLTKLSPTSMAIKATTLDFLRRAILDRDRPDLIVLDPPRAGAGIEVCELLNRLASPTIIYVSCDPTTLARDLAILQTHYNLTALHLIDLFPQTSHIETIAILTKTNYSHLI